MAKNIEKVIKKKKNKKNTTAALQSLINVDVTEHLNGKPLGEDVICEDLFNGGDNKKIVLKIFEKEYGIIINSPWADLISLPNSGLAGYPISLSKFDSVFGNKEHSVLKWYKSKDKTKWNFVSDGFVYTPTNDDVDYYLKISCVPKNDDGLEGPTVEDIFKFKVEAGPGFCPFENRHKFTQEKVSGREFRVVSYNILADLYCDSDYSRTCLFPYCPAYALEMDYRKQLIFKELLGYNADLICLQEVDQKIYNHNLRPLFEGLLYDSNFQLKGGTVAEGLTCIFNTKRFKQMESNSIILGEHVDKDPIFAAIWTRVRVNDNYIIQIKRKKS